MNAVTIKERRDGNTITLWVAAGSEADACEHAASLNYVPTASRWAGAGNYRSDVYIVTCFASQEDADYAAHIEEVSTNGRTAIVRELDSGALEVVCVYAEGADVREPGAGEHVTTVLWDETTGQWVVQSGPETFPASGLRYIENGMVYCPQCGDACHESHLRTIEDGAVILGCSYCLDTVPRCTSDDPTNHQGDTCPVHERDAEGDGIAYHGKPSAMNAALRATYWDRTSAGWVSVYDGDVEGLDTSGGRWGVVCENHGAILNVRTLSLAHADARRGSAEFCEDCREHADKLAAKLADETARAARYVAPIAALGTNERETFGSVSVSRGRDTYPDRRPRYFVSIVGHTGRGSSSPERAASDVLHYQDTLRALSALERFFDSARLADKLARLERSPYVVTRRHSGTEDGPLWYVTRGYGEDAPELDGGYMHAEHAADAALWFLATVAAYARDWASDCTWPDVDPEDIAEMTSADVLYRAARHYAGGLAALTADGIADAEARDVDDTPELVTVTPERVRSHPVFAALSPEARETIAANIPTPDNTRRAERAKLYGTVDSDPEHGTPGTRPAVPAPWADLPQSTRDTFAARWARESFAGGESVTDAQALTVAALAEHYGEAWQCSPDVSVSRFGTCGALVAVFSAASPAPNPVVRVWAGGDAYTVTSAADWDVYLPELARQYAERMATERADDVAVVVHPGGTFEDAPAR